MKKETKDQLKDKDLEKRNHKIQQWVHRRDVGEEHQTLAKKLIEWRRSRGDHRG